MSFEGPFQPKLFRDSIISIHSQRCSPTPCTVLLRGDLHRSGSEKACRRSLQGQRREGITAWTLTRSEQCSQIGIFHCQLRQVLAGLTDHHGHETIKAAHTAHCNLSETLLFEFNFKRGKVTEINIC